VGHGTIVSKPEIYAAWKSWCEETNHLPGGDSNLAKLLLSAIPGLDDTRPGAGRNRVRCWTGVRLRTYIDDEDDGRATTPDEPVDASNSEAGRVHPDVQHDFHGKQAPSNASNSKHTSHAWKEEREKTGEEKTIDSHTHIVGGACEISVGRLDVVGQNGKLADGLTGFDRDFLNHN